MSETFCSVVMTTFRTLHNNRARIAAESVHSLLNVDAGFPFELVLIDNTHNNRGLGAGRNLGAKMATGDYICICDDDILFAPGWLGECIRIILSRLMLGDKVIATPIHVDRNRPWWKKHYKGKVGGFDWHSRSGSNCMVMTRTSYEDIGPFDAGLPTQTVGVKWHDTLNRKGYKVLLTPKLLAVDMAFKKHSYK